MGKAKTIENVTVENLKAALRQVGIEVNAVILDRIIDVVELLEMKGSQTTIKDLHDLKKEWGE